MTLSELTATIEAKCNEATQPVETQFGEGITRKPDPAIVALAEGLRAVAQALVLLKTPSQPGADGVG